MKAYDNFKLIMIDLLLRRPISQEDEANIVAKLDGYWEQMTDEEQVEMERFFSHTIEGQSELNLVDVDVQIGESKFPREMK